MPDGLIDFIVWSLGVLFIGFGLGGWHASRTWRKVTEKLNEIIDKYDPMEHRQP